ncbi:MAG: pseudaminic acid synthase [Proteobacteria bacterium]|nr:pseudaminic acid synthase [Pseudomonadota bacterium]MBU1388898.1 pseudaminic acid synthase [Pseudomonadota bacterium]MBU1543450.1 pseudaminic acid synthase [Pseudomonadota bacterium]MBU2480779.1 pseudaminic acid synthase [Pseudomonadota bacterium]
MKTIKINNRQITSGNPAYIIAEMSANHNKNFDTAVKIIEEAKKAGADAIKLQTYTPETITLDCDNDCFRIKGTIWQGKNLFQLYKEAFTPWEWQPKLKKIADDLNIDLFSTPFDDTAVDFLEKMNVPAYKIASFELIDLPLLKKVAATGKPVIMSTGMASLDEIREAVNALKENNCHQIALLKCTSAYPALPEEANLKTIPDLSKTFNVPAGLSDHTMGSTVAVTSIALGACIIEKHFCLSRKDSGPDASFSMEPDEFTQMVKDIRTAEKAIGKVSYELTEGQEKSKAFRRSLFAVENIKKGDLFTPKNIRSIRPGNGLPPKHLEAILGKKAKTDIQKGTPLTSELICQK